MSTYSISIGFSLVAVGMLFYLMGRDVRDQDPATVAANTFRILLTIGLGIGLVAAGLIDNVNV